MFTAHKDPKGAHKVNEIGMRSRYTIFQEVFIIEIEATQKVAAFPVFKSKFQNLTEIISK